MIVPREDPMGVICELASAIGPEYFALFIHVVSRTNAPCGRYESPPLQLIDVKIFVSEYAEFIENDSRHEFWIGSTANRGMLVYDDHGIIYAYGPLDDFERLLATMGFEPGGFSIPSPHTHNFHAEYDEDLDRLVSHWDWRLTELRSEDER